MKSIARAPGPDARRSFRVTASPDGSGVEARGIEDLMTVHGLPRIEVLKIDIEGAERGAPGGTEP